MTCGRGEAERTGQQPARDGTTLPNADAILSEAVTTHEGVRSRRSAPPRTFSEAAPAYRGSISVMYSVAEVISLP
jgi:hypothetical protein